MTSIFSNYYLDNLRRINSSARQAEKVQSAHKKAGSNFAQVLSDLEQRPKNIKENLATEFKKEAVPIVHNAEPQSITNLSEAEQNYSRARLSTKIPSVSEVPANETSIEKVDLSVKTSSETVKTAPPVPMLPQAYAPPQMPKLVSAKRVTYDIVDKKSRDFKVEEIKDMVVAAGKYHGVDPLLGLAVAEAESSFRHDAVSRDGHHSKGVFQLLDSTGKQVKEMAGIKKAYDPFDPGMNVFLGVAHLRRLMDLFGSNSKIVEDTGITADKSSQELEKVALAAYNAGEGSVAKAQDQARALGKNPDLFSSIEPHLPQSTREYVRRVARIRKSLAQAQTDSDTENA